MPPMRFGSRVQFEEFSSQFPADERTSEEWQFSRCYVISENSVYAGEALKLTARKHLKRLNRRLHKRYMDSL